MNRTVIRLLTGLGGITLAALLAASAWAIAPNHTSPADRLAYTKARCEQTLAQYRNAGSGADWDLLSRRVGDACADYDDARATFRTWTSEA